MSISRYVSLRLVTRLGPVSKMRNFQLLLSQSRVVPPLALSSRQLRAFSSSHLLRQGGANRPKGELKRTPLYDLHVKHGGKMVPFGGWDMPVEYKDKSIAESSVYTRNHASLFDVSHMTQHIFEGKPEVVAAFLERVTPSSISSLKPYSSTYSAFLNERGGIVDDTIITYLGDSYYIVTNAANYGVVTEYFRTELDEFHAAHPGSSISWNIKEGAGLVSLQGPDSATILQSLGPESSDGEFDLSTLTFGHSHWLSFDNAGVKDLVLVSRTGYTGEDGFELSTMEADPVALVEAIMKKGVPFAGLGARDTLRLEAGLCLHGSDINADTTPRDVSLAWIIPKSRRSADAGFKGADVLYGPNTGKPKRKRVGIVMDGPVAARPHCEIHEAESGDAIGEVTSGGPSPTLKKPIAMALVDSSVKVDDIVSVVVRGKARMGTVVKMPFVPTKYYKGPQKA